MDAMGTQREMAKQNIDPGGHGPACGISILRDAATAPLSLPPSSMSKP
jgi:hypothetical protein